MLDNVFADGQSVFGFLLTLQTGHRYVASFQVHILDLQGCNFTNPEPGCQLLFVDIYVILCTKYRLFWAALRGIVDMILAGGARIAGISGHFLALAYISFHPKSA